MTKEELFHRLSTVLQDTFEIDPELIRPEARLREDLDIDSIDAVDLIVQFRPYVGKRLQPDVFKSVRTLQDVVDALHGLMQESVEA